MRHCSVTTPGGGYDTVNTNDAASDPAIEAARVLVPGPQDGSIGPSGDWRLPEVVCWRRNVHDDDYRSRPDETSWQTMWSPDGWVLSDTVSHVDPDSACVES